MKLKKAFFTVSCLFLNVFVHAEDDSLEFLQQERSKATEEPCFKLCGRTCSKNRDSYKDLFNENWSTPCEEDARGAGRAEYEEEIWSIDYFAEDDSLEFLQQERSKATEEPCFRLCGRTCSKNRDSYKDLFNENWSTPCEEDARGAGRAEYEEEIWSIDYFK